VRTISALKLNFPRHYEKRKLMVEHNLTIDDFSSEMLVEIGQSISAIRKTHGLLDTKHFKPIQTLLVHDWLPEDISVLLPQPSFVG
jgi:hypothetical protein